MPTVVDLSQNTPEWHAFRKLHIGASETGAIMGLNPYRSAKDVWQEKVYGKEQPVNDKMRAGTAGEEEARRSYEMLKGFLFAPMVLESTEYPFLSASMDGMSVCMKYAVEIKCGASSFKKAEAGIIENYYYAQMQQQMFICNLSEIDFYCYYKQKEILIPVSRNPDFIANMLEKEIDFWDCVQLEIPPED